MSTRWNRHTLTCNGYARSGKACQGCESGSADRAQRRLYALRVLSALLGQTPADVMTCPLTGRAFLTDSGEVDRIDASLGYVPGNVILTSREGNAARGKLQALGRDLGNVTGYAHAVRVASDSVSVPAITESRAWHTARSAETPESVLAGGMFA